MILVPREGPPWPQISRGRIFLVFVLQSCPEPFSWRNRPCVAFQTVLNALNCTDSWACHFLPDNPDCDLITVSLTLTDSISTAGPGSSSCNSCTTACLPSLSCSGSSAFSCAEWMLSAAEVRDTAQVLKTLHSDPAHWSGTLGMMIKLPGLSPWGPGGGWAITNRTRWRGLAL